MSYWGSIATLLALVVGGGCTGLRQYVENGFKVGPNYAPPSAPVAEHWIDSGDVRTGHGEELSRWWQVFNDSTLDRLVLCAYRQNLSVREAGFRVLAARAQRGMTVGELFPQRQEAFGSYLRESMSRTTAGFASGNQFLDQWNTGFSLAWELDFWGRLRRAIAAADDQLDASVAEYDQVLVTLLGDVTSNYVLVRTDQERLRYLRQNVTILELVLKWTERRETAGIRETPPAPPGLNTHQIESTLEQTRSGIPQLKRDLRVAENRLCVLMGMPPADLRDLLGEDRIPTAPPELAIGIPAELLRRRPDVRRAERLATAQSQAIGIAEADLYPVFSLGGTLGWQSKDFSDLFSGRSLDGNVGPSFQWKILNYGRIANNIRYQDARFQELVTVYQQTVLRAAEEAEDGLVTFLQAQDRMRDLAKAVAAASAAVKDMFRPFELGQRGFDFNRFALIQQNRIVQQDLLAQSRGEIALGLIQVYRALGGGWEIRLEPAAAVPQPSATPPSVVPEGAAELQKLRDLLDSPAGQPVPVPEPPPKPPAGLPESRQPT